jgi:hypothetical protein
MGQQIAGPWPGRPADPEQRRRQSAALRQVEWADTYLHAVESLEVDDAELKRLVARAREALVAVELRLRRLAAS